MWTCSPRRPAVPAACSKRSRQALNGDGFQVRLLRATQDGDFAELQVSRHGQTTQLDLGRDWRAHEAVTLDVGPVLHLDDTVGSKTTALLGRALPRDYIDVAAALSRYPRRQLLELAFHRDRGLRVVDVALAAQRLDRLDDALFLPYLPHLNEVAELPSSRTGPATPLPRSRRGGAGHARRRPLLRPVRSRVGRCCLSGPARPGPPATIRTTTTPTSAIVAGSGGTWSLFSSRTVRSHASRAVLPVSAWQDERSPLGGLGA